MAIETEWALDTSFRAHCPKCGSKNSWHGVTLDRVAPGIVFDAKQSVRVCMAFHGADGLGRPTVCGERVDGGPITGPIKVNLQPERVKKLETMSDAQDYVRQQQRASARREFEWQLYQGWIYSDVHAIPPKARNDLVTALRDKRDLAVLAVEIFIDG